MAWLALFLAVVLAVGAWRLVCPGPPSRLHRLLRDACRLAGVPVGDDDEPVAPGRNRGESRRWREERCLVERGWSW